jgi:hypothetical protein
VCEFELFCGGGLALNGFWLACFTVVGVDSLPPTFFGVFVEVAVSAGFVAGDVEVCGGPFV